MSPEELTLREENQRLNILLDEWKQWRIEKAQPRLDALEGEIEELKIALEGVIDALEDVINQACSPSGGALGQPELDSLALSAYAHGLRELAKHGKVKIEHQVGRRVIAHWTNQ